MIRQPRRPGSYPDRWLDCQQALEPVFLELVRSRATPYIDLVAISGSIFAAGYEAGWSVSDIAAAVEELAVNYQLGTAANRATDDAIRDAMARTIRH